MKKESFYKKRDYIDLNKIYPNKELKGKVYSIDTFSMTESEVSFQKLRSSFQGNNWYTR